jgi:hypothetical protein
MHNLLRDNIKIKVILDNAHLVLVQPKPDYHCFMHF